MVRVELFGIGARLALADYVNDIVLDISGREMLEGILLFGYRARDVVDWAAFNRCLCAHSWEGGVLDGGRYRSSCNDGWRTRRGTVGHSGQTRRSSRWWGGISAELTAVSCDGASAGVTTETPSSCIHR